MIPFTFSDSRKLSNRNCYHPACHCMQIDSCENHSISASSRSGHVLSPSSQQSQRSTRSSLNDLNAQPIELIAGGPTLYSFVHESVVVSDRPAQRDEDQRCRVLGKEHGPLNRGHEEGTWRK